MSPEDPEGGQCIVGGREVVATHFATKREGNESNGLGLTSMGALLCVLLQVPEWEPRRIPRAPSGL
jgi:hypothetical protein